MGPDNRGVLLEVTVEHGRDVAGAQEGGADRLQLAAPGRTGELSPEPARVTEVCRETDLPVFVTLRLNDSWTTTGGELTRLVGLAEDYLARGAAGLCFGFLDSDLLVDTEVCGHLAGALPGVPWTFPRALDNSLEPARAWRQLLALPGLAAVCSAGSPQGLGVGFDELLARSADPRVAALLMPASGLLAEHVWWFVRAGVRMFQLGPEQVRPGGTSKAYVDAAHVRSWRLLADDALARLERSRSARSAQSSQSAQSSSPSSAG